MTVILSERLLAAITRRASSAMLVSSSAYTCAAPALAAKRERMPEPLQVDDDVPGLHSAPDRRIERIAAELVAQHAALPEHRRELTGDVLRLADLRRFEDATRDQAFGVGLQLRWCAAGRGCDLLHGGRDFNRFA